MVALLDRHIQIDWPAPPKRAFVKLLDFANAGMLSFGQTQVC
jgi:hypothetical protein